MIFKKIQQMFCKHEWVVIDSYRFSDRNQDGIKRECFSCIKKCAKCSKIKEIFMQS